MDVSGVAAQIVAMQSQALQMSLAMAAMKQAQAQQQAVVDLTAQAAAPVSGTERGSIVDVLV